MTGTDMNLNISYQDTQYLSELYAKLGSLQCDLANFDIIAMKTILVVAALTLLLGVLAGVLILGTAYLLLDYHDKKISKKGFRIGLIVYSLIVIAICVFACYFAVNIAEYNIIRDIESTEMAIESIKMKYGLL